jgi:hypothetical protein
MPPRRGVLQPRPKHNWTFFTFAHQLDLSPFWPTNISLRYLAKTSVYQDIEVLAETCIAKAPHECIVIYVIQGFPYFHRYLLSTVRVEIRFSFLFHSDNLLNPIWQSFTTKFLLESC